MMLTRRFLLAASAMLPLGRQPTANERLRQTLHIRRLVSDQHAARTLGLAYLEQFPTERDERALLSALIDGTDQHDLPEANLRARLAAAIANDWRSRDIVHVLGWTLARTEARICALIALT